MGIKTVDERLAEAAALFKERNAAYGNEFVTYGATLHTLFPDGVTINTPELWQRIYGIILMQMKLRRYAKNTTTGGHADSLEDLSVYAQMSAYTDALAHDAHAQVMAVVNETAPEWKQVPARDLLDGETIIVSAYPCKIIKIRSHHNSPYAHITLDNGVVIQPYKTTLFSVVPDDTVGGGRDLEISIPLTQNHNWDNIFAQEIRVGDTILDWDNVEQKVSNVDQFGPAKSFRVDFVDGTHVFLSRYKSIRRVRPVSTVPEETTKWVPAQELRAGDILRTSSGDHHVINTAPSFCNSHVRIRLSNKDLVDLHATTLFKVVLPTDPA